MRTPDELRRDFSLLSEDELAAMLELKLETIRQWRSDKQGPAWVKLGKGVYYRDVDVFEWIDRNAVSPADRVQEAA